MCVSAKNLKTNLSKKQTNEDKNQNNIVTKKHNIKMRMINFVAHKICLLGKNSGSNYVKAHWMRRHFQLIERKKTTNGTEKQKLVKLTEKKYIG